MISVIKKIFNLSIFILFFYIKKFYKFDRNNHILKHHIIVSLTTCKENIKSLLLDKMIKSLLNQTLKPYKILLSINKEDIVFISDYMIFLIKKKIIEIIFADEDYKNFNKFYYIPNKYKKYIIIVFDDDIILEKNSIQNLFNSYLLNPQSISARRVYKMKFNQQWILQPFNFWEKDYKEENNPKFYLFAINGAGTLFPPNRLNITDNFIFYFKKVMDSHDFIIKYYELNENLKTVYVKNNKKYYPLNNQLYQKYSKLLTISPNEIQLKEDFGELFNLSLYNNILKEKVEISNDTDNYFLNNINKNKITNETLLVSMTSYPGRIYGIYEVFLSLLNQSANISLYQCFLTLAKEEFIDREKNLPFNVQKLIENGWIKMI